jgi:hypothetical protein
VTSARTDLTPDSAERTQRTLDASVLQSLPVPEVIESDWGDLMPMDRALFDDAFAPTQPGGL